jgi:hypothetical protein
VRSPSEPVFAPPLATLNSREGQVVHSMARSAGTRGSRLCAGWRKSARCPVRRSAVPRPAPADSIFCGASWNWFLEIWYGRRRKMRSYGSWSKSTVSETGARSRRSSPPAAPPTLFGSAGTTCWPTATTTRRRPRPRLSGCGYLTGLRVIRGETRLRGPRTREGGRLTRRPRQGSIHSTRPWRTLTSWRSSGSVRVRKMQGLPKSGGLIGLWVPVKRTCQMAQ